MPLSEKQALALNGKGVFGKVTNYSALPSAISHDGETWICLSSQGTPYITALFGGTYYPSGQYYSVGGVWLYDSTAYQASLSDVNAGIITDQWVSPNTLANSTWAFTVAKVLATTLSGLSVLTGGVIASTDTILEALGKLQNQISLRAPIAIINDLSGTSTITGWSSFTTKQIIEMIEGNKVTIFYFLEGISDNATTRFTVTNNANSALSTYYAACQTINNGTTTTNASRASISGGGSNIITFTTNWTTGAFTASGTKSVRGTFVYYK